MQFQSALCLSRMCSKRTKKIWYGNLINIHLGLFFFFFFFCALIYLHFLLVNIMHIINSQCCTVNMHFNITECSSFFGLLKVSINFFLFLFSCRMLPQWKRSTCLSSCRHSATKLLDLFIVNLLGLSSVFLSGGFSFV